MARQRRCRRVRAEQAEANERLDVVGFERTEAMPDAVDLDFEQRLEPEHAAAAGAYDVHGLPHGRRSMLKRRGDGVSPDGECGGVARDEQAAVHAPASVSSASSFAAVRRPTGRLSIMAAGLVAHRPRQYAGSTVTLPPGVVLPLRHDTPRRRSTCATSSSPPIDWQASARHSLKTWVPGGSCRKSW